MNRDEFLLKISDKYNGKQNWADSCEEILAKHINYEELYKIVLNEWESNFCPSPAWLKKRATYKKLHSDEIVALKKIEVLIRGDVYEFWHNPAKETFYQAKENLTRKFRADDVDFEFKEPQVTTEAF